MKLLFLILASVVTISSAQSLENLLATQCKTYDLPSMSAIVFHEGEIIESACHGLRRRGFPQQVTLKDRYHLGSITKSMTSSLAAIIVEEKKISWDDSIEKVLGKSFPKIHADYRDVTLRQLCEHRGGMPTHRNDALWSNLYERNKKTSPEKPRMVHRRTSQASTRSKTRHLRLLKLWLHDCRIDARNRHGHSMGNVDQRKIVRPIGHG